MSTVYAVRYYKVQGTGTYDTSISSSIIYDSMYGISSDEDSPVTLKPLPMFILFNA